MACAHSELGTGHCGRRIGTKIYCDHQENRKSVIGRDHLRVPSGVPLPAVGLKTFTEWLVYQPMG